MQNDIFRLDNPAAVKQDLVNHYQHQGILSKASQGFKPQADSPIPRQQFVSTASARVTYSNSAHSSSSLTVESHGNNRKPSRKYDTKVELISMGNEMN